MAVVAEHLKRPHEKSKDRKERNGELSENGKRGKEKKGQGPEAVCPFCRLVGALPVDHDSGRNGQEKPGRRKCSHHVSEMGGRG